MAGKTATEIVVGANGSVRVAVEDAAIPDELDAYSAAWTDLGYLSEDGVTFTNARTMEDVNAWQSFYALRKIVTGVNFMAEMVLRQFGGDQVELAFGGGTVEALGGGLYHYVPPAPEVIDVRRLAVDWMDGDRNYRLIVKRTMVSDDVAFSVARTKPSELPLKLSILGEDGVDPWEMFTDDPRWAGSYLGS